MLALIDTGNTSIQLPNTLYEQLKGEMMKQDSTIHEEKVSGHTLLVSRKKCEDLYDVYSDFEFMLHKTYIKI